MKFAQKKVAVALACAMTVGSASVLISSALAQQPVLPRERVEVTGTNIKRIEAETGLPVSVIRAEDLARQGITTAEQILQLIPQSQSSLGISQGIGLTTGGQAEADLRGLGGNKTLVLLNGRRIANHAYQAASVDLNAIPVAAIERIEVLRDGASAIYGTDAIGGVINFILRKDYQGVEVSGEYQKPEKEGGETTRGSLTLGYGSLDKDRFNVFGVIDYRKQKVLRSIDRDFAATGIRPDKDLFRFSGTGFPANVSQGLVSGNPYFPGCRPAGGSVNLVPFGVAGNVCRFDFTRLIDIIPENEQLNIVAKGTLKLGNDHLASLEYVRAETKQITRVAPTPVTGLTMPANSPYYPGSGITPAVAGIDPTQPLGVAWRTIPAGQRTNEPESVAERLVAQLEGVLGGWDYQAAALWNKNTTKEDFTNGYIQRPLIVQGITGTVPSQPGLFLNPFDDPTTAEAAYINSTKVLGRVIDAKGEVWGVDAKASRDIWQLPAGPLALAVGAEYREEKFTFDLNEPNVRPAASSGLELATDVTGKRNVTAVFAEVNVPIIKQQLEAQFAVRYDRYSDVGNTTNPKVALRYTPNQNILLRASYNHGFRAPTLYEINQPEQLTFTSDAYDDPLLCPGGVPVAGANPARDCGQQFHVRQAGNKTLEPEKSRTYTVGVVLEPVQTVSFGVDYWHINLKNQINVLGEQTIFGDPVKYADRFFRCGAIDPALAGQIPECFTSTGSIDPLALAYINTPNDNLGDVKTAGFDFNFVFRPPPTAVGKFVFRFDGTYVDYYDYQREKGGVFVQNAGSYQDASPIFRWQHTASLLWSYGSWSAVLANRYKGGYTDQDPSNRVGTYSVFDTSVTYQGIKNLTLTFGIKNIADRDPPFTNQGTTFQVGYDPRYTDPLGRTYTFLANYAFR
jgi:iron complex outermembrane receptor protein